MGTYSRKFIFFGNIILFYFFNLNSICFKLKYIIIKNDSSLRTSTEYSSSYVNYDEQSFLNQTGSSYDSNFIKLYKNSDYLFFEINLLIEEDGKKIAYTWDIKKLEINNCCFPETTLIFYASPESVEIETDSKNYFLNYKIEEKSSFPPLIFLPTIRLNIEKYLNLFFLLWHFLFL